MLSKWLVIMQKKFNLIVADPPWSFSDKLTMSKVKRGARSQYKTMTNKQIYDMPIGKITEKEAMIALWVPSSKLQLGMDCLKNWGFVQKQTWIWVKVKNDPFNELHKRIYKDTRPHKTMPIKDVYNYIRDYDINESLAFGMGRYFRNVHEIVLIGVKGKITKKIKNKSQRTVYFWPVTKHSKKPDGLQDMLEIMLPGKSIKKIELFARRERKGWVCIGNEVGKTKGQDIYDSLNDLIK